MTKATISDIAREAGVSVTTVSRFINGHYHKMSLETRTRLQSTVDRMNYHPSASARRMRQSETHVVGLIVGDISNVFSSLLFKGIYNALQPAGYDVMLMNSNNDLAQERDEIGRLLSQQVDGLIIQPNARNISAYQSIISSGTPLVLIDREVEDCPVTIGSVVSDNKDSCYCLGKHLSRLGYQRIILFSRIRSQVSAQTSRVQGFMDSAAEHGTCVSHIEVGTHGAEWLVNKMREVLGNAKDRTVVVSLMGPLLFDILEALTQLDVKYPEDIGLVSFDDWRWSKFVQHGIYLIEQDSQGLGRVAAENLLERIRWRRKSPNVNAKGACAQLVLPVTPVIAPSI